MGTLVVGALAAGMVVGGIVVEGTLVEGALGAEMVVEGTLVGGSLDQGPVAGVEIVFVLLTGLGSRWRGATASAEVSRLWGWWDGPAPLFGCRASLSSYECRPDGVGWHHQYPTDVYPMVVYQSASIRLQAAVVEGLDLAVQAPVA